MQSSDRLSSTRVSALAAPSSPRRRSWGTANLNVDLPQTMSPADDPFYSPSHTPTSPSIPYSTPGAGPSTTSLLFQPDFELDDDHREDDEAGLTQNMALNASSAAWHGQPATDVNVDAERAGGLVTPRSSRRSKRYGRANSLRKTGSAIKSVSRSLRRASLRVVNLSTITLENQVRLPDDDDEDLSGKEDNVLQQQQEEHRRSTPLRGRTLGFFGPESKVRLSLYQFLVHRWTEPFILVLIIINAVILTIQSAHSLTLPSNGATIRSRGYFHTWEDFALFAIFIVYTLEAFARICVSGFLFDPEILISSIFSPSFYQHSEAAPASVSTSLSRQPSFSRGASITKTLHKIQYILLRPFTLAPAAKRHYPQQSVSISGNGSMSTTAEKPNGAGREAHDAFRDPSHPTYLSSNMKSDSDSLSLPFRLNVDHIDDKTRRNLPYLRHSWGRIDFVAVLSFWIAFALALDGLERGSHHIGVFRAMSVIRCARLLAITYGTTTIMHSLKVARPLLASTAYFVVFAMILFSIIGVQSFRGSLRRSCYLQPTLGEDQTQLTQFCGGHINPNTLQISGYVKANGRVAPEPKGFICPLGQLCIEANNPNNNVESFDTIYNAALQVIIIASANTWSQLMYSMLDAEYFVSCIFFIVCIIILNFWLFNLFVAVITNTFDSIRTVTKKSAFGAVPLAPSVVDEQEDGYSRTGRNLPKRNIAYTIISHTEWCWILLAFASLVLQATRTVNTTGWRDALLFYGELGITIAFDVEMFLRIWASLPDWRSFFRNGRNVFDLILAVGSSVIQIPAIHSSSAYPWFSVFQLARFYRVILVVPNMKPMMLAVFGNLYGLLNMMFFLLLVNYLAGLVAVQFLRGDVPGTMLMNFSNVYNSFLAVYQLSSSENWTTVLYGAASAEVPFGQTVITIVYLAFWFLFSYFIILQMFIAVLNENFSVAEELKKSKQASSYWATQRNSEEARPSWMHNLNPYRWLKANPVTVKVDNLPSNLVLPMQKSLVQDYNRVPLAERSKSKPKGPSKPGHYVSRSITALHSLFVGKTNSNDIPLRNLRQAKNGEEDGDEDESDRHLALLAAINGAEASNDDLNDVLYERRAQKADFIRNHPSYDRTFWVFSQKNWLRRTCQKLVQPANGERLFGTPCSTVAHPLFQLVLLLTVVGGIAVESIATPLYRRAYYTQHGAGRFMWFDVVDTVFGLTLLVEFLIKIVADGFLFTPNAYVKSIWNVLDFFVMVGLVVNVTTGLIFVGGLSRLTRALKALPALKLITLVDRMRYTFQSLLIAGAPGIVDAAELCILYMIPYAVWGLNIFAGKMNECNDTSVNGLADCIYEYNNSIFGSAFGFMVPRAWDKPSPSTVFSFDSFRDSLLILFEIVSLEGWIDVLGVATSITGINSQPQLGSSPANAIFFVIYNLLGGVVLLTIFVSIIIGNFSAHTGIAYLTGPQREWIDLQKLIKRQRPLKRPKVRPTGGLRGWCFDRAVQKHGWWSRAMTVLIVLHIFALMTQNYSSSQAGDRFRNFFFLGFTAIYIIDVLVRSFGLGWSSFRANGWNLFDVFISIGSFITTATVQTGSTGYASEQLQKLFLVSIAFKLVQRADSLNMLFKTSVSSLPAILNLLGLWVIFFIFFAILYLEVFSMTKWASAETRYQNYTTLARSIVMLIFMSTGEGWNQYMHDFALTYPRCTIIEGGESDCGSTAWSFSLFIAWNLLSMYIFANLFTGVVVQNFSYVFQSSEGSTKSITREQMRLFKKVWAEFADTKTGYLHPSQFGRFFSRLTGVFEVRIYPAENSVGNILTACKADGRSKPNNIINGIDTSKLAKNLSKIDYTTIRKRKLIYNRVFHEARVSHQGQGISFTDMLLLLAHHKIIVDTDALVLKDFLVRTETNKLVTDLVNLDRVRSLLKTFTVRRRYLEERDKTRLADLPSIIVDVMPSTPPASSRDISSALHDFSSPSSVSGSPMSERRYTRSDLSFVLEDAPRLRRSPRRTSDISMLSADLGSRSPRISFQDDDPQAILSSIKNSMWGELMQEAAEEEEHHF
ncbi:hypothetical protein AX15_001734 [Amanita polypyramis BW_CC]|nr:hypothetical protein AX15_001734 [Amanita polypyramis BW_CC]